MKALPQDRLRAAIFGRPKGSKHAAVAQTPPFRDARHPNRPLVALTSHRAGHTKPPFTIHTCRLFPLSGIRCMADASESKKLARRQAVAFRVSRGLPQTTGIASSCYPHPQAALFLNVASAEHAAPLEGMPFALSRDRPNHK